MQYNGWPVWRNDDDDADEMHGAGEVLRLLKHYQVNPLNALKCYKCTDHCWPSYVLVCGVFASVDVLLRRMCGQLSSNGESLWTQLRYNTSLIHQHLMDWQIYPTHWRLWTLKVLQQSSDAVCSISSRLLLLLFILSLFLHFHARQNVLEVYKSQTLCTVHSTVIVTDSLPNWCIRRIQFILIFSFETF